MRGFLLIDKEKGLTSFDVIARLRRITGVKKIGHAGTLDPLATGLLLVAVGEATKLLEYFIGCDKEYEVVGHFGAISDTYDAEGRIAEGRIAEGDSCSGLTKDAVESCVKRSFVGEIDQVPPVYSALKIAGKRAADRVRAGESIALKARKVRIDEFKILSFDRPRITFSVKCSTGTYIRSLIHDLGQALGCGAYVEELRRVRVANFSVEKAVKLENLSKNIEQCFLSMEEVVVDFEKMELTDLELSKLSDGRTLLDKKLEHTGPVMAFHNQKLLGVLENTPNGIKFAKLILTRSES